MRIARSITVGRCDDPNCKCVHIGLLDEDEKMIATAALPVTLARGFLNNFQNILYEIATENIK